jgi:hypothetical protein
MVKSNQNYRIRSMANPSVFAGAEGFLFDLPSRRRWVGSRPGSGSKEADLDESQRKHRTINITERKETKRPAYILITYLALPMASNSCLPYYLRGWHR